MRPHGVRLAVRLSPRASRDGLDGVVIGADGKAVARIRLAAPPVDGAANAALVAFLARALSVRKGDIRIHAGETSRTKLLDIDGDGPVIAAKLAAWLETASEGGAP